jgi:hypothetical protein
MWGRLRRPAFFEEGIAMSVTKPNREPDHPSAPSAQDEIEQIMNEIEQLQKEIGQTEIDPANSASPAKSVESPSGPRVAAVPSALVAAPTSGPTIKTGTIDTDPLEEFRASSAADPDQAPLEETLADLKDDGSSKGGILDVSPDLSDLHEQETERRRELERVSRELNDAFDDQQTDASYGDDDEEAETVSTREHDEQNGTDGMLTMTLRGNMTLKLQYEMDGQCVSVGFSDQALRVELADGTEFKIPMRSSRGGMGKLRRAG